jgi:hypothetical protein
VPGEFERLAVLVEDRLRQLEQRVPLAEPEKLRGVPIGDHGPEHALGPRRLDAIRGSQRLVERSAGEIDPHQGLGQRRDQDGRIDGQWRTLDDPDPFELEDVAGRRDAQRPGLRLEGRTDPRLTDPR